MSVIQVLRIALKIGWKLWQQKRQAEKQGRTEDLAKGAQKLERNLDNAETAEELADEVGNYFDGGKSDSSD